MRFSLIHPSRERAQLAYKNALDILMRALYPTSIEYIIVIDSNDPQEAEYCRVVMELNRRYPLVTLLKAGSRNCVQALNCGAEFSTGDILVYVSEDFVFPLYWDASILNAAGKNDDFIMWVKDGIQIDIMTSVIQSRKYYEHLGYLYHGSYHSMFADDDMTAVAKILGKIIMAHHIMIKHNHPSIPGGLPRDKTFENQNHPRHYEEGKKNFEARKARNFDL